MNKSIPKKIILISSIGGIFEFYDFIIYASFGAVLADIFFADHSSFIVRLLTTYLIFAIGYLGRPLGGLILAHIGDKKGRKTVFMFTLFLMAVPTLLIGCLPTYNKIGVIAPILLVIFRFCQGAALGGEMPAAATFVHEHSDLKDKNTSMSYLYSGFVGGILLGTIIAFLLNYFMTQNDLYSYGWRIPFIIGGVLALVGSWLRKSATESPEFNKIKKNNETVKVPIYEMLKTSKISALKSILIAMTACTGTMIYWIYFPVFLKVNMGYSAITAFRFNILNIIIGIIFIVTAGKIANKITPEKTFILGSIILIIIAIPSIIAFKDGNVIFMLTSSIVFNFGVGCIMIYVAVIAGLFQTPVRFTGFAFSVNIAFIFAGFLPVIVISLISATNSIYAISFLMIAMAFVGLFGIMLKNSKNHLQDSINNE